VKEQQHVSLHLSLLLSHLSLSLHLLLFYPPTELHANGPYDLIGKKSETKEEERQKTMQWQYRGRAYRFVLLFVVVKPPRVLFNTHTNIQQQDMMTAVG
jgi:hypothetical protein